MRLQRVDYDSWTSWGDVEEGALEGDAITWEAVERIIRRLDGARHTEVVLAAGEEVPHMIIGGGPDLFIVNVTFDFDTFHLATTPDAEGDVDIVAGGQRGRFKRADSVGLEQAVAAARAFAEETALSPSLSWRED